MRQRIAVAAGIAFVLVATTSGASAQQAYTSTSAPPLIVKLNVVAAPGVPAVIAVRNGEIARWTRTDGTMYSLSPIVANGIGQLLIAQITPGETSGSERFQALATLTLAKDKATAFPTQNPLFTVTLLGTAPIPTQAAQPSSEAPCQTCCVTCGEWTACACAVKMDCGSCCCRDYCPTCLDDGDPLSGGCTAATRPADVRASTTAVKR